MTGLVIMAIAGVAVLLSIWLTNQRSMTNYRRQYWLDYGPFQPDWPAVNLVRDDVNDQDSSHTHTAITDSLLPPNPIERR